MKTSFLVLLGLLALSSAVRLPTQLLRISPKNGEIALNTTENGHFIVHVDLEDQRTAGEANDDPLKTVQMIPIFYKSETLLPLDCLMFQKYECGSYQCTPDEEITIITDYLTFKAEGLSTETQVFLDYSNWNLKSPALYASKCTSNGPETTGMGTYGYLAMGTANRGDENFIGAQEFSIVLEKDGKNGMMYYSWNAALAEPNPSVVLSTDANWQLNNIGAVNVGNKHAETATKYSLIFDINTELIRLPAAFYTQILDLIKEVGITCASENNSKPVCKLNNMIKTLPTITLYSEEKLIVLPPQLYAVNGANDSFVFEDVTLNLQQTSPEVKGDNYVSDTYSKHIILGSSFMRHYITRFDVQNSTVTIYNRSSGNPSNGSGPWIWVLVGLVVIGLAVGFYLKSKSKGASEVHEDGGKSSLLN